MKRTGNIIRISNFRNLTFDEVEIDQNGKTVLGIVKDNKFHRLDEFKMFTYINSKKEETKMEETTQEEGYDDEGSNMITSKQKGYAFVLFKEKGFSDEDRKAKLVEMFSKDSIKLLTKQEGIQLIDYLTKPKEEKPEGEESREEQKIEKERKEVIPDEQKSFGEQEGPKKEESKDISIYEPETKIQVITNAVEYANALKDIIDKQNLAVVINGKKFVKCEGWQVLGALLKCTPRITRVEKVDNGYIAEAEVVNINGQVLSKAQAMCLSTEKIKKRDGTTVERWEDEYAVMSMAQTRAVSKAFRLGFSWIINIAGYEVTPAEEMKPGMV